MNQAWMEGVLQELKWRDEKIMKLENKLHKAAILIEEGDSESMELKREYIRDLGSWGVVATPHSIETCIGEFFKTVGGYPAGGGGHH